MKISKEKQMHLALVGVGTVIAAVAMWYFLIEPQRARIVSIRQRCGKMTDEINKERRVISGAGEIDEQLAEQTNKLYKIESTMPSGDIYSWIVGSVKQFNVPSYHVNLQQFSSPDISEVRSYPSYPYMQVRVSITGSGYYHDLGRFFADFENKYPYLRLQSLALDPFNGTAPEDKEKIFFRVEVLNLCKPNQSTFASQ